MNDLRNFLEVATTPTMREAADRLGITQPSLSESIKRLESDLKETLFYRSRSGVTLTPGGQVNLHKAREVFSALEALENGDSDGSKQRVVTLGCHPTIASYFLPSAFRMIGKRNLGYRIRLRHDLSRAIQLEVQQGRIDVGIVVNAIPSPDLVIRKFATDDFAVWKGSTHAGGIDKIFCNLSLVQTQAILRKWKKRPSNIIETDSLELIGGIVGEGLGYGILPTRAVRLLGPSKYEMLSDSPVFHDKISIVYRPEFGKHPDERLIIESIRESASTESKR